MIQEISNRVKSFPILGPVFVKAKRAAYVSVQFLLFILPRRRCVWVFGNRFGKTYAENSKHLFEYVNRELPGIRAIWLTRNEEVQNLLRNRGFEVYHPYSLRGWFASTTAGAAFVSVCLADVNRIAVTGAWITQLCHGIPLKSMTLDGFGRLERYNMVTLAAEEFLSNCAYPAFRAFCFRPWQDVRARFVLTGYPRLYPLFCPEGFKHVEDLLECYGRKRLILYVPTHRETNLGLDLFGSFGFDVGRLGELLERNGSLLVIRLHPVHKFQDALLREQISESPNIHMVDSDDALFDVCEYLRHTDVLITDYSSVFFDFLPLDKPIIFAPFDIDEFVEERELLFPYDEVTPGPKVRDWSELIETLARILEGEDQHAAHREEVRNRFVAHADGGSSYRVCREVCQSIGLDLLSLG